MKKLIFLFLIISANLNLLSQDIVDLECNGLKKNNQHQVFACDGKPGAPYGEINYNFCASKIGSINRIIVPEMIFDEKCPCNDLIKERILINVASSAAIQELFLIRKGGEQSNFELFIPKLDKKTRVDPPKGMECEECRKSSANNVDDMDKYKATVYFEDACEPGQTAFRVKKVKISKW